jgi:hypothetical protein
MLRVLNIPKWFSELSQNFIVHFGQPAPEPVLTIDEVYDAPQRNKHKLIMSILGFFNLGLEFNPVVLSEFIAGLGSGRPFFFSFFLSLSLSLPRGAT